MIAATAAIILNQKIAKQRKDKKFPVKLRITFRRKYKLFAITYSAEDANASRKTGREPLWEPGEVIAMSEKEFEKVFSQQPRDTNLLKNIYLNEIRNHALRVIESLGPLFSFERFEKQFIAPQVDQNDLLAALQSSCDEFTNAGKISTATTYKSTIQSLKEFTGKEKLTFQEITVKFLKDYEKWMVTPYYDAKKQKTIKGNSITTVSIYLRNVQTVFNHVKPAGIPYPFGKTKDGLYSIPKWKNVKKALSQSDIVTIANYQTGRSLYEQRSRDFWLFSYLCNGINIKDLARLKYENIQGDKIVILRAKTSETTQEQSSIIIPITPKIRSIIDRWGNKPASPSQFVFDILAEGMSPLEEYRAVRQAYQTINKNMTRICKSLKIDRATTYTARHSFATVLKRSGASIEFISESLGHKSKQTTMNYLANFGDDEKRKWANVLLPETDATTSD